MADNEDDGISAADKKKLEGTNMENYGGKEHRNRMQEIAKNQPEWHAVPDMKPNSVLVWRIEQFKVVEWDPEAYGDFYSGDSFIVLHKYLQEDKEQFNVHFWLGKETSQDEAGSAAIKTVEVDDLLGDLPVQFREVQGHESKEFLNLFDEVNILNGGVDSGFRKVLPKTYTPRLIHVIQEGKKIRNYEIPLDAKNINNQDTFVLDLGEEVISFVPPKCSAKERRAANGLLDELRTARNGRAKKHIYDWGDDGEHVTKFWDALDGDQPKELPDTSAYHDEQNKWEELFANHVNTCTLVSDASGEMVEKQISEGVLEKGVMKEHADDVLLFDVGRVVYIWIGSGANRKEISHGLQLASQYLMKHKRPMWTPCKRVICGKEPCDFFKCFNCKCVPKDIV